MRDRRPHSVTRGPLEGVTVLAPEQYEAAPFATMILADLGADVIRVEPPNGEGGRRMGPLVTNQYGEQVGGFYFRFNRNKRSIVLDLKTDKGKQLFLELVRFADVVVENFRPRVMDKLGLGYQALRRVKPDIIYASISGFGHPDIYQSPYMDRPAFDLVAQAMSGLMFTVSNTGEPHWVGFPIGDHAAGVTAAIGILAALVHRARTGEGQHVDIAMYDSAVWLNERWVHIYDVTGTRPTRESAVGSAPYGPFAAKDGYIAISGGQEPVWPRFCKAIGREDLLQDPRLQTTQERARHRLMLKEIVEEWLAGKTRSEAVDWLLSYGVPAAPIHTVDELFECPHLKARNMICEFESPYSGKRRVVGNPIKLSLAKDRSVTPPPELGEHTEEILREMLGLSPEEIKRLEDEGVVVTARRTRGKQRE